MSHYIIYLDESGEISLADNSPYKRFVLTALIIEEEKRKKLYNNVKRKKAELYANGWPKEVEIKAATLHSLKNNHWLRSKMKMAIDGDDYIERFLGSIISACNPRIDYLALNKEQLISGYLKRAEYGIAYNYFAGRMLFPLVRELCKCRIIADPRNKERHARKYFSQYIKTGIYEINFKNNLELDCCIEQPQSHLEPGLQAVDFFSWSIFRKYESSDPRFFNLIKANLGKPQAWYC